MHIQKQPVRRFISQKGKLVTAIVSQRDLYVKWDGMTPLEPAVQRQRMTQDVMGTDVVCRMALRSVGAHLAIVS